MLRCGRWCELLRERIGKWLGARRREIVENFRRGNHRLDFLNELGVVDRRQGDLQNREQNVDRFDVGNWLVGQFVLGWYLKQLRSFLA